MRVNEYNTVLLVVRKLPLTMNYIANGIFLAGCKSACQWRRCRRWLGRSPGEGNDIHSSMLAWKIPCTEEPGRLVHGVGKELDTTDMTITILLMVKELVFSLLKFIKYRI